MAILISKCCVCGAEYGKRETKGVDRYSHGYCSSACRNYSPVQVYREENDTITAEVGYEAGGLYYHNGLLLREFIGVKDKCWHLYKLVDDKYESVTEGIIDGRLIPAFKALAKEFNTIVIS